MEAVAVSGSTAEGMEAAVPLRIAQVVGHMGCGGVEAVMMNYFRTIDRDKVQFDVIMEGYDKTRFDDEILSLGGRVYKVAPYSKNIMKSLKEYYDIFSKNKYQIVHAYLNTLSVFPLLAAKLAGVPVRISHNQSTASKGEPKTIIKYMLRPFARVFSTHYFACSAYAGKWLFGKRCFEHGKIHLVPNAIDSKKFEYNPETRNRIRKILGIDDKYVVGHVGRFVYQKNHDFLIDIFSQLHKKDKDSVLLLVGSGELEPEIKEKVKKLGLTESVLFMGARTDEPDFLQAMDVFVLPSFYEGLPVVGVEAQAAGLKCIVSDTVTAETKITDLVEFVSLEETASEWAEKILSYRAGNSRTKMEQKIQTAGYEITGASSKLLEWYQMNSCRK